MPRQEGGIRLKKFALFVLKRLIAAILVVIAVVILSFFVINLAPGNPAVMLAGEAASPEYIQEIAKAYGLDKPLQERLVIYLEHLLVGDWGYSTYYQAPVLRAVLDRLPATLLLMFTALSIAIAAGIYLGAFTASRAFTRLDALINYLGLIFYSFPAYWLALMLVMLFSLYIPVFPTSGMMDIGVEGTFQTILNVLWHMVLPVATLSLIFLASYLRLTRSVMIDVLSSNYIFTAVAKGLPKKRIIFKHALKNAIIPVIAMAGTQFGQVIAGAVLTETIFSWPGIGSLLIQAVTYRDYPLVIGIFIMTAIATSASNFVADILMARIDPRIKAKLMG
ncbi:MAG: ABC transporter permease [Fervidicoccaceae archaeon]